MKHVMPLLLAALLAACSPAQPPAQAADFPAKRCINLANALNAPNEGDWTYRIKRADIVAVARAGFDTIRVPIAWSAHTDKTPPYTIDPAFFARVDEVVTQALNNHLRIVIDVHNFEDLDKYPDTQEPRFIAIWQQIAWHYAKAPDSVIFELMNEPMGKMKGKRWESLLATSLAEVRKTNPTRWVIVGGDNWNSLDGMAKLHVPDDPYLVLTWHDYEPYEFTHQGAPWFDNPPPVGTQWGSDKERADVQKRMARAARIRERTGHPVWLGEFGTMNKAPMMSRIAWTRAMRQAADEEGIGWCAFDFGANFNFYDDTARHWNRPLLESLMGAKKELRH